MVDPSGEAVVPNDLNGILGVEEKRLITSHLLSAYEAIKKAQNAHVRLVDANNPAHDPVYAKSRGGFFLNALLTGIAGDIYSAQLMHDDAQKG